MHRARTRAVLGVRHSFVLPIISDFTFTFICHLGKTHDHRSRGDTPWRAQNSISDLRRSQVKSHMSSLHIGERSLFGLVFPGQTWNSKKWRP